MRAHESNDKRLSKKINKHKLGCDSLGSGVCQIALFYLKTFFFVAVRCSKYNILQLHFW